MAQQITRQREASGNWKDKSILDKSRRSGNNKEQISVLQAAQRVIWPWPVGMQPLGVDERRFLEYDCYESSGRDWSARSAPIGGERVCFQFVLQFDSRQSQRSTSVKAQ
ncbi:hypothetical protein TNCV_2403791 [Trichonephila clavipes]|uniref:Uncharacterized protein n=1 Tax=Trichonephila clavipes TaxID=2585209 RepID=A0A8X6USK6_TRICX|nr:hypothetical protein TNCV_2403791 [Trichonephila clavipes]